MMNQAKNERSKSRIAKANPVAISPIKRVRFPRETPAFQNVISSAKLYNETEYSFEIIIDDIYIQSNLLNKDKH